MYWLYWFTLVYFERRYSGLTPYLFNQVALVYSLPGYSVRRSLLWLLSGWLTLGLLSLLSLWFTLCRILWPILSPLSLSPPFLWSYRRYRYAIRLTRNADYFV